MFYFTCEGSIIYSIDVILKACFIIQIGILLSINAILLCNDLITIIEPVEFKALRS